MQVLRDLVIGVSDYKEIKEHDLHFCKNDISAICDALISGLKVEKNNIYTCGASGTVNRLDLIVGLRKLILVTSPEDTLIFYLSGHGGTLQTEHHIVLSDCYVSTKEVIEILTLIRRLLLVLMRQLKSLLEEDMLF